MRRLIILLFFTPFFFIQQNHAQWSIDIDNNVILGDSTKRVGLGISSPLYKLHVIGDGYFSEAVQIQELLFGGQTNALQYPYYWETIGVSDTVNSLRLQSPNAIHFHTQIDSMLGDSATSNIRMTIAPNGYVGIGTQNPRKTLDIFGNVLVSDSLETTVLSTSQLTLNDMQYPSTDGEAGQVLTTDSKGTLAWTTVGDGLDFSSYYGYACEAITEYNMEERDGDGLYYSFDDCGILYDSGGPSASYTENEDHTFDIWRSRDAVYTRVIIETLEIDQYRDTLFVQGIPYFTNINSPDTLIFDGNYGITIAFKSDGVVNEAGFVIKWDRLKYQGGLNMDTNSIGFFFNAEKNSIGGGVQIDSAWSKIGEQALLLGYGSAASGFASNAVGYYNEASADFSSAFGYQNEASGHFSSAFGYQNEASEYFSSAFGRKNQASGIASTAFGRNNKAIGSSSSAFGYQNESSGRCSNAFGYQNEISHDYSSGFGYRSQSTGIYQMRFGNSYIRSIGGYQAWTNLSDQRLKKNFKEDVPGLAFIAKLRPVTYQMDMERIATWHNTPDSLRQKKVEAERGKERRTGFIAQEVAAAAKAIGYEFSGVDAPQSEEDRYGLRYAMFVVPLVKAVQEQQEQIEEKDKRIIALEERLAKIEALLSKTSVVDLHLRASEMARLDQNAPNPFSNSTQIGYFLPETTGKAVLHLFDGVGRLIKVLELTATGEGIITISTEDLPSGAYQYTLMLDGKPFDSKQMVLSNQN